MKIKTIGDKHRFCLPPRDPALQTFPLGSFSFEKFPLLADIFQRNQDVLLKDLVSMTRNKRGKQRGSNGIQR